MSDVGADDANMDFLVFHGGVQWRHRSSQWQFLGMCVALRSVAPSL